MLQQQSLARVTRKPFTAAAVTVPCRISSSSRVQRGSAQPVRAAAVEAEPEFDYKTRQYDPKELSISEQDPELLNLPKGYHWYETMLVLRATLGDEDRDRELAKFEAFLNKEHSNWEGIYILYTYAARRSTARAVQQLLSNPEAGSEDVVLRFVTFCKH
ncbi:plastid ribosomal protein S6 [Monoraphidium neglectum]|uniref:Plastid ribosomal protein S6 n=1 Tax=Monoraphidium neglectum TaxID=145388 RepID=A0A0D2MRZ3_9CHLO|nr:plastid ribosomal protein S6 [Monoraphidium neglectum]KIZ05355.1 plastid ribosomal protein S6 [Monoraphidium neglectum]|eukprot:XP_013904374.1 plastid ribosomal protein S6 [Monoraphidium neglectum]